MSTDSYNYFGRDETYLDKKLLPFVKCGGYVYIAIPGMVRDCHDSLPSELLLSWTPEQLDYMHDVSYWTAMVSKCRGAKVLTVEQMQSNEEVWADRLAQDNEYAVGDRRSMDAGAGKHLNFIKIVLQKNNFAFWGIVQITLSGISITIQFAYADYAYYFREKNTGTPFGAPVFVIMPLF